MPRARRISRSCAASRPSGTSCAPSDGSGLPGWRRSTARTFVGEVRAPLTSGERAALDALLAMLWSEPCPEVSPADWAEYRRLCGPGSPDAIADEPDYYGFFTYSLFRGTVPGPGYH